MQERICEEYFEWLSNLVSARRYSGPISFRRLLVRLHDTPFRYLIRRDKNRAEDGVALRRKFILQRGYDDSYEDIMYALNRSCSVLEMMVALAVRCEESIMDDPFIGNRTSQWFWGMINNLGLGSMYDANFKSGLVDEIIERFLNREYEPDGEGGLFRVRNSDVDLRTVEIWYQLCWYLDTIS